MTTQPTEVPIFKARAHVQCSTGPILAWYTSPPGVVVQLTESAPMTEAMASWVAGPAFAGMVAHFPDQRGFIFIVDLRAMTTRAPNVRAIFMELVRESGSLLAATVIIPPRRANPLYLGGLQTASELLTPFGPALQVTTELEAVLQRYQLQPATG